MTRISRETFLEIVKAGIQAPSADNHHPLFFDNVDSTVGIWIDRPLASFPFHRKVLLLLSLGAVAENLSLRAGSLGFKATIHWFTDQSDDRLVARLRCDGDAEVPIDELADYIDERQTNRRFFHGPRLSTAQLSLLEQDAAAVNGVTLKWLDELPVRRDALRLIRIAERERYWSKELHQEMFSSIRFDVGWNRTSDSGLAPGSLEVERPLRPLFEALRNWTVMRLLGLVGGHHLLGLRAGDALCRWSPHLGVLTTTLDVDPGALAVGRALERVWLRATGWHAALHPLAASSLLALDGYSDVRPAVRHMLAQGWRAIAPGTRPLIVLRLGRSGRPTLRSGRQPLSSYLR